MSLFFPDKSSEKSTFKCACEQFVCKERALRARQLPPVHVSRSAVCCEGRGAEFIPLSNDAGLQQTSSFVLLHSFARDECCFATGGGGGASFKIEMEPHSTSPPSDKICATRHACFMMSVTRHSEPQKHLCRRRLILIFVAQLWFSRILVLMRGLRFSLFWLYRDMFMV